MATGSGLRSGRWVKLADSRARSGTLSQHLAIAPQPFNIYIYIYNIKCTVYSIYRIICRN